MAQVSSATMNPPSKLEAALPVPNTTDNTFASILESTQGATKRPNMAQFMAATGADAKTAAAALYQYKN
jgi:hypothetical protein